MPQYPLRSLPGQSMSVKANSTVTQKGLDDAGRIRGPEQCSKITCGNFYSGRRLMRDGGLSDPLLSGVESFEDKDPYRVLRGKIAC